mmetsp:Transcript_11800/g.17991  ORF Transcript_11800/g.17991 Transcript_11800/m.17991 type:complete len:80 (-) Transcript_11800:279-518(-)
MAVQDASSGLPLDLQKAFNLQVLACAVFFAQATQDSDRKVVTKILFGESKDQLEWELRMRISRDSHRNQTSGTFEGVLW